MQSLNAIDIAILVIFFISILAGLMRGVIRELLALFSWVAAIVLAALFSAPMAQLFTSNPSVQSVLSNASGSMGMNPAQSISMVAIAVCFFLIFMGVLLLGSLVNYIFSSLVEAQGIGFTNRLLGGIFGLARGFIIVLVIVFLVGLTPLATQNAWRQSQFVVAFQPSVEALDNIVAPEIESLKEKMGQTFQDVHPGQIIDQIKQNFKNSGASQYFQQ